MFFPLHPPHCHFLTSRPLHLHPTLPYPHSHSTPTSNRFASLGVIHIETSDSVVVSFFDMNKNVAFSEDDN
jgi:hypothetical protein